MQIRHILLVLLVAGLPLASGLDDVNDVNCLLQRTNSRIDQRAHVIDRLWHGEDLTDNEHNEVLPLLSLRLSISPIDHIMDSQPNMVVRVLGMFGAGTNLMASYLRHNFGDAVLQASGVCESSFGVKLHRVQPPCKEFWKHTHPLRIKSFDPNATTVLVAMVRNPISQMASWNRSPFNLWPCMETSGQCTCEDACDGFHCASEVPNYFPCGQVNEDSSRNRSVNSQQPIEIPSMPYFNTTDVWNAYGGGYQGLADMGANVKLVIVQYEELVLDPTAVLKRLAGVMGRKPSENAALITGNQRKFDNAGVSRDRAIDVITTKSYRIQFTASERRAMCAAFEPRLLAELGFQDECVEFD